MKHTKRVAGLLVALLVVCFACLSLTACNKDVYDPEERPFSMSISTPDGVFNPFFSTSAYDSQIISMTQISMLSTDPYGKIVAGDNEPTVVKDYTEETKTENGKTTTTYEFLIKNGIKWSDGEPLTIKDVLFNLYVYLDPVYTGSATIYSTDIIGLQNYRQQTLGDISDTGTSQFEAGFIADASARVDKDVQYVQAKSKNTPVNDRPSLPNISEADAVADFAYIAKTFYQELISDYNAINLLDYKDWNFTEKWQIFLLNDGGDQGFLLRQNGDGSPLYKDDNGNYKLDEDHAGRRFNQLIGPYLANKGLATQDSEGNYVVKTPQNDEEQEKLDTEFRNICVDSVFQTNFTQYFPMELVKRSETKIVYQDDEENALKVAIENSHPDNFETIAKYWGTATTVLDKFTADAKTAHFASGERLVPTISGITTRKEHVNFNSKTLGEEYDVLTIKINGVDPKAIYNFAFTVAPMHYYSTTNWNGHNYIAEFDAENGKFGLEFGNSDFMNEVINDSTKIGLPVGGGAYMASSGVSGQAVSSKTFFNKNMIYYERNPYFYTLGSGIENAKIKYMRYKVVESDQILNALVNGDIDLGDPSAKKENQDVIDSKKLESKTITTNGYGYVGINPRFVPDVNIRRAIMKALDAESLKDNYYKGNFCETIYRPMTKESWAYPDGVGVYTSRISNGIGQKGTDYSYDGTGYEIEEIVKKAGYTKVNEVYQKTIPGFGVDRLDYKFTIAGGSTDHPAYSMFLNAAQILNSVGFDVKVVTSQQALSDLSAGKLAVWAAAWSSTIDPDMFQVYHRDSQASSTKNWGYSQILGGTNDAAWGDELIIVNELSKVIDDARSITDEDARAELYADALDLVMELAVEFPTYQRKDLTAYQSNMLDPNTLPKTMTSYSGLLARIWEINYIS